MKAHYGLTGRVWQTRMRLWHQTHPLPFLPSLLPLTRFAYMAGEKKDHFRFCYYPWPSFLRWGSAYRKDFGAAPGGAWCRNRNSGERLRFATAHSRRKRATLHSRQDLAAVKCCPGRDNKIARLKACFFLKNRFMRIMGYLGRLSKPIVRNFRFHISQRRLIKRS